MSQSDSVLVQEPHQRSIVETSSKPERQRAKALEGWELVANMYADLGFDVFPVHSMERNPKTKRLECTCMSHERKKAREVKEPEPLFCDKAGKHARGIDSWKKRATKDREIIQNWSKKFRGDAVNVGVATGPRSGIWILDIDGENGKQSLEAMEEHGELPDTVTAQTGSGGYHFFFRWTEECANISISANQLGSGLDVRGDGGYIVAPPSLHKSGKRYQFVEGYDPTTVEIVEAPAWLVKLASQKAADKKTAKVQHRRKKLARLEAEAGSSPEDQKRAEASGSSPEAGAEGWEHYLTLIGDGEGQKGFDTPINQAACSYFTREGKDAEAEPLKDALKVAIEAAYEDPQKAGRKQARYLTDEYLDRRIEESRDYVIANKDPFIFDDVAELMEEMNKKVALIFGTKTNTYVVNPDGDFILKPKTDAGDYLAPYSLKTVSKKGVVDYDSAFGIWMKNSKRRQRRNFIFEPGMKESDIDFNTFKGFTIQPKKGDWSHLDWHIRNVICDSNEDHFRFLMALYANIFQEPRNKPGVATVMRGLKRIGKSTVGDAICDIIGLNHSITLANRDDITGRFNWHFAYRLFALMEEAHWPGDHAGEAVLKQAIVGKRITLEQKFLDKIEISNHMRINIIGNADWIVPTSEDDARFFALDVNPKMRGNAKYFADLHQSLRDGGCAAFHHALLEYNYEGMNLREPPVTAALQKQIAESFEAPDQWWRTVLDDGGFEGMVEGDPTEAVWTLTREFRVTRKLVFASWLTGMTKPHYRTPDRMGRFLKKLFPDLKTEKSGAERFYVFSPLADVRAAYTEKFGYKFD